MTVFAPETASSFERMARFDAQLAANLSQLKIELGDELSEAISTRAPIVTMIGQVKAGKTALTTALSGHPNLLPTDVNPWTSVVTSLNFNQHSADGNAAIFKFFDEGDWRKIVDGGGRLGELARRTERDDELEKLRQQVDRMYAKSKKRLGRNFELLLGKRHAFTEFNHDLLERYICMGDSDSVAPGRYADITRSADLYLQAPHFAVPITLRDTPGVNDPFLVREQITLRSLADADVCLVVLSAHQALATTDLGLIRVLSSLQQSRIVLFVNRIDELTDPHNQCREIEARMRTTLRGQGLSGESAILFGSALWASHALDPEATPLPDHSRQVLEKLGVAEGDQSAIWAASGLSHLQEAVGQVMLGDGGLRIFDDMCRAALEQARRHRILLEGQSSAAGEGKITVDTVADSLDPLISEMSNALEMTIDAAVPKAIQGIQQSVANFNDVECGALRAWLDKGESGEWSCDVQALRRDLALQHSAFAKRVNDSLADVLATSSERLAELYATIMGDTAADHTIAPPNPPQERAPIALSQTISLDMDRRGWKAFLGRLGGVEAQVKELRKLINIETLPLINELRDDYVLAIANDARDVLRQFLTEQSQTLLTLIEDKPDAALNDAPATVESLGRIEADLSALLADLTEYRRDVA